MDFDGLTLKAVVQELKKHVTGARIDRVFMPARDEIDLLLRSGGENKRLKISVHSSDYRLHLTRHAGRNPDVPPVFCMFLRKHLVNGVIEGIDMPGFERVVVFRILSRDEMGARRPLRLVAELMGRHSNAALCDENGRIMECLRHVGVDVSRVRQMLPSLPYSPPPSDKKNPLELTDAQLAGVLLQKGSKSLVGHLCACLQGLSQASAHEMLAHLPYDEADLRMDDALAVARAVRRAYTRVESGDIVPRVSDDGGKEHFSMFGGAPGACVNELADAYYHARREAQALAAQKHALQKAVQKHIERREKKLQLQRETLEEARQAQKYRHYGDLVTANLYRLKKGADALDAEDYTRPGETVRIALDGKLSPAGNAGRYYKRYGKLKNAAQAVQPQIEENRRELEFLGSVLLSVESSETLLELEEIREELVKTNYLPEKKGKAVRSREVSEPHEFLSTDGFTFYAGKNNRQNDILTMKYADANDMWLHVKDMPGPHVLIRTGGKAPPDRTLHEAAVIAATLGRAAKGGKTAVDYTLRRHVKKPGGSKPGMVVYENYRTLVVRPDAALLDRLKKKKEE